MRISDWSSDVCSSDLAARPAAALRGGAVFAAESVVAGAYLQIDTVLVKLVLGDAAAGAYQAGLRFVVVDRKSVVSGKSVSVRVDLGGRRIIKKKKLLIHRCALHRNTRPPPRRPNHGSGRQPEDIPVWTYCHLSSRTGLSPTP